MNWGEMTRAARDAAYNNVTGVADSAALNRVRIEASAVFRAKSGSALDVPYGRHERMKWDLYPARDPKAPCLVFIHGGYWMMNSREQFACLAEGFSAIGWSVAMPSHRLAPEASMADIVADIDASLDWLQEHRHTHGLSGPVVISGWSAGAHLAVLALSHPLVSAGLAVSGLYELGPLRDTYLDEKLKLTDAEIATLSPLRLPAVQKPLAIAYGSQELPAFVDNSRRLHAQRADAHAPGALVPVAGADHFTILIDMRKADGLIVRQAQTLLP